MTAAPHLVAVNFRDPAHPEAGGAELHLEEILLEAIRRGWRVTWLASGVPGKPERDEHRGMRILRRGSWWNFNLIVPRVVARELVDPPPDLVIEDINKVPCFTPLWTRAEVAVIVPHLFGTTAFQEATWPIAIYVQVLEALIPWVYRRCRFVVISESTRDDLVQRGISPARISVVHCGMDHESYRSDEPPVKTPHPSVVYVGRLRRYKGVDGLIRSFQWVLERVPDARLEVIGDGPDRARLERLVSGTPAERAVSFRGFLPREAKARIMREGWVVVQPSPKEGWGLTVIEAGASGTAVVAADSPGLRDSVRRDVTGLLVPFGDRTAMADAITRVLQDGALRERLAAAGKQWAASFRWPVCAARSLDALTGEVAERADERRAAGPVVR